MPETLNTACALGCNATASTTGHFFGKDLPLCANWEIRHKPFCAPCDFCGTDVWSDPKYDDIGHAHWLVGRDNAGSDAYAIWCGPCGPKHRKNNNESEN